MLLSGFRLLAMARPLRSSLSCDHHPPTVVDRCECMEWSWVGPTPLNSRTLCLTRIEVEGRGYNSWQVCIPQSMFGSVPPTPLFGLFHSVAIEWRRVIYVVVGWEVPVQKVGFFPPLEESKLNGMESRTTSSHDEGED